MDRQLLSRLSALLALALVVINSGCKLTDRRVEDKDSLKTEAGSDSAHDPNLIEELKTDSLSKAHSPGRSAATWSSEAREIESHFNVR